jgi:hypothetical protein
MDRMQTRTDSLAPAVNWFDPFGSWEAARRWNAIASEWMTRGWQQWLELVTVWPALEAPAMPAQAVLPAPAGTQQARNAHAIRAQATDARESRQEVSARPAARTRAERPGARAASKRSKPKRPPRAQAAARPARTRG